MASFSTIRRAAHWRSHPSSTRPARERAHQRYHAAAAKFHHDGFAEPVGYGQARGQVQALHEEIDDVIALAAAPNRPGDFERKHKIFHAAARPPRQDADGHAGRIDPVAQLGHRRTARAENLNMVAAFDEGRGNPLRFNFRSPDHRWITIADQEQRNGPDWHGRGHRLAVARSARASISDPEPIRSRTSNPCSFRRKKVA